MGGKGPPCQPHNCQTWASREASPHLPLLRHSPPRAHSTDPNGAVFVRESRIKVDEEKAEAEHRAE